VAGAGQPQRLGALPGADVQHPQRARPAVGPVRGTGEGGELFVELAGDQLLADGVPEPAEACQPALCATGETGGPRAGEPRGQSLVPRATCGLGRRSRRIWRVRISP
jgi:hypothetical protein